MWEKFKNIFKKKEEPAQSPVIQLQVMHKGSWVDINTKREETEGKNKPKKYRQVITLPDGRVEMNYVI